MSSSHKFTNQPVRKKIIRYNLVTMEITQANLLNTIFLTFSHNQYAIAFFCGSLLSLGLLLIKPSRFAVLLLIGFIILFIGFEYDKHIIESLQNQTIDSLGLSDSNSSEKLLLMRTFQKIVPFFFFVFGWGSVFLAILIRGLKSDQKKVVD